MAGERRKRLSFRKLYSFKCLKPFSREDDHSQIGTRAYSRVVFCNDPDNPEAIQLNYRGNYVSTTKYIATNFIPKSLFEQFRRVANIYFLVVAFVSFSPLAPYSAPSVLAPLLFVIGATMVKEGVEDWRRRKQDIEANNRKVEVLSKNGTFGETKWKDLRVGDLVKDEYFPADLLLLSSSYEDGICYVETMNLDGETNLKLKQIYVRETQNQDGSPYIYVTKKKCVLSCASTSSFLAKAFDPIANFLHHCSLTKRTKKIEYGEASLLSILKELTMSYNMQSKDWVAAHSALKPLEINVAKIDKEITDLLEMLLKDGKENPWELICANNYEKLEKLALLLFMRSVGYTVFLVHRPLGGVASANVIEYQESAAYAYNWTQMQIVGNEPPLYIDHL